MKINTLADLILQVESTGDWFAVRFEPAHNPRSDLVIRMMHTCNISHDTARVLCQMSFGGYQIMGDNLMALGLTVSPLQYCASPGMQTDFFNKFLLSDHLTLTLDDVINDDSKRALFVRLWNGPGNVDAYSERLLRVYQANTHG